MRKVLNVKLRQENLLGNSDDKLGLEHHHVSECAQQNK
jgi:hypothetical protein